MVEATPQSGLVVDIDSVLASFSEDFNSALNGEKVVSVINDTALTNVIQQVSERGIDEHYQSDDILYSWPLCLFLKQR